MSKQTLIEKRLVDFWSILSLKRVAVRAHCVTMTFICVVFGVGALSYRQRHYPSVGAQVSTVSQSDYRRARGERTESYDAKLSSHCFAIVLKFLAKRDVKTLAPEKNRTCKTTGTACGFWRRRSFCGF